MLQGVLCSNLHEIKAPILFHVRHDNNIIEKYLGVETEFGSIVNCGVKEKCNLRLQQYK